MSIVSGKQKAVAAVVVTLVVTFLSSVLTALQAIGDNAGFGDLSTTAWLTIAIATLVASGLTGAATYGVENKPTGRHRADMGV